MIIYVVTLHDIMGIVIYIIFENMSASEWQSIFLWDVLVINDVYKELFRIT